MCTRDALAWRHPQPGESHAVWRGSHISASRMMMGDMLVRCVLCGMIFDDTDLLIDQRKKRHAQWHDPTSTSRRRNMVAGRVSWEPA